MSTFSSTTPDLLSDHAEGILTLTLNRPERRNALSRAMLDELIRLLDAAERSPDIGCVVLTGADDSFCAGGDVKQFRSDGGAGGDLAPDAQIALQRRSQRGTVGMMYDMSTPVVASLPGVAAGAGVGLALAADLRIGSPQARMVPAFLRVGLPGDYGTAWLLAQHLGASRARQVLMLNQALTSDEMLRIGILAEVVPTESLAVETRRIARALADGPRLAIAHMKANLNDAVRLTLAEAIDVEVERHVACARSDDHREGVAAFADRREPSFAQARQPAAP